MSLIDQLTGGLGGMAEQLYGGLQPQFMQQTSGADMRKSLLGHGVGGMMDEQKDYYSNLMGGNVPKDLRMNIIGAGQDLASGDALRTGGLLAQGGMSPGSNLGAMLSRVSSSNRGNDAISQLAKLAPEMMTMGQRGYDANLQDRAQLNTQGFNLDQTNLADKNQAMQQTGRGIMDLLKMGGGMMKGPLAFMANKIPGLAGMMKQYQGFQQKGWG